jgi:Ca2+-binding EF-hand superfamily protein
MGSKQSVVAIFLAAAFLFPAHSNAGSEKEPSFLALSSESDPEITLEEVDISKDGKVSPEESKAYLQKLDSDYNLEIQKQKDLARQATEAAEAAEAQKPKPVIDPADANRDGTVSPEEMNAYLESIKSNIAGSPKITAENTTDKKEAEKDKDVPANLQKKYDKRLEQMNPLDTNQDGKLQVDELSASTGSKFDSADTNKDGILSSGELSASQQKIRSESLKEAENESLANSRAMKFKSHYKRADEDDDGQVSKEEYNSYFGGRYQTFDRDGDGVITEKEYRGDLEKLPSSYRKNKESD